MNDFPLRESSQIESQSFAALGGLLRRRRKRLQSVRKPPKPGGLWRTDPRTSAVAALTTGGANMKASIASLVGVATLLLAFAAVPASAEPLKNIVLVHGAWVDASGWKAVYEILTKEGFHVTMVQEPETSFADDVAATKRVLDLQSGPTLLVGHSYGGSIITEAGVHPNVA